MKNPFATAENTFPLAVLIDADNVHPRIIPGLLAAIAKLGSASVKRIYGDWTTPNLGHWKNILLEHAIQPVQQFAYTSGKNSTDSAMIIDAMDLLYTGNFRGFCLVSSDSDFTRLAVRIRESGKRLYGFGEKKTPRPFVVACDEFSYTEAFEAKGKVNVAAQGGQETLQKSEKEAQLIQLMRSAITQVSNDSGRACLSEIGNRLREMEAGFKPKTFGYKKLSDLVIGVGVFDLETVDKQVFISDRNAKRALLPE